MNLLPVGYLSPKKPCRKLVVCVLETRAHSPTRLVYLLDIFFLELVCYDIPLYLNMIVTFIFARTWIHI